MTLWKSIQYLDQNFEQNMLVMKETDYISNFYRSKELAELLITVYRHDFFVEPFQIFLIIDELTQQAITLLNNLIHFFPTLCEFILCEWHKYVYAVRLAELNYLFSFETSSDL